MIIYSVTVSVEASSSLDWLTWMQNVHIPDVMNTGYFIEHHIQELLDPVPQPGMVTFNIQYHCKSMTDLKAYQEKESPWLQQEHNDKFKDRFVAFRTILKRL
jgi:uncharacterized protein (UPF0305 family)